MKLPGGYRDPDPGMSLKPRRPNRLRSDMSSMDGQRDPGTGMSPHLIDRINDDGVSRNLDPSTEDLESRVATTAAPQYRPVAPDDTLAQMQSDYQKYNSPKPQGLLGKIAEFVSPRYERYVQHHQDQGQQKAESLLSQITAQKRMEEQERNLDTRAN